jgi:pilus assembly protein Flp/PilA
MFLAKIGKCIKKFLRKEDGASAIEYVIIVAMVALVVVGLSPGVGTAVTNAFGKVTEALSPTTKAPTQSGGNNG